MLSTRTGTTQADLDKQIDYIRGIRADIAKLPDAPAGVVAGTGAAAAAVARPAQAWGSTVPPAAATPAWAPTHLAPPDGLQSWDQPDASRPMTPLAPGLELAIVQRIGDWAQVRAINGWSGWVARRLCPAGWAWPRDGGQARLSARAAGPRGPSSRQIAAIERGDSRGP